MLFNSIEYFVFLSIVCVAYYAMPHRFRWLWMLAASYYFYASWNSKYLILILASSMLDYFLALRMGQVSTKRQRKPYLLLSLSCNLGLLFIFKYFLFFREVTGVSWLSSYSWLLPVGISFYTFQTLSYSIDTYRGNPPQRNFGVFLLYVSFFPQLVAGPIERSTHLIPQLFRNIRFDVNRVVSGLQLILWGLFKKVVIADRAAIVVDKVYSAPDQFSGPELLLATFLFAFQIFCDFSGYTDIAIGSARIFGFELMQNFRRPYFATDIADFWRRWHISLSTWFRDYLYIPLGGNRVGKARLFFNLLVVFVLSGLWHGANWTFVVWGALHGSYLILQNILSPFTRPIWSVLPYPLERVARISFTFILVCIAWVFFRAADLSQAMLILSKIWMLGPLRFKVMGLAPIHWYSLFGGLLIMEIVHFLREVKWGGKLLNHPGRLLKWSATYAFIVMIMMFGTFSDSAFIYFQF